MVAVIMGANDSLVAFFISHNVGWAMPESFIEASKKHNPTIAHAAAVREHMIKEGQLQT